MRERKITAALFVIILAMPVYISIQGHQFKIEKQFENIEEVGEVTQSLMGETQGFTENKGQWHDDIMFMTSCGSDHFEIGRSFFLFNIRSQDPEGPDGCVVKYKILGCSDVEPRGVNTQEYYKNYIIGGDRLVKIPSVRTYSSVILDDIYPGVDLAFRSGNNGIKYEFIVEPGARPEQIRMRIEGPAKVTNTGKDLVMDLWGDHKVFDGPLVVYQEGPGRLPVSSGLKSECGNIISYAIGKYDPAKTLVIDPLVYSTYFGGGYSDEPYATASDSSGDSYFAGETGSGDFPTTAGCYDSSKPQSGYLESAFVTKISGSTGMPIFSTFVEGYINSRPRAIVVDRLGNTYVTGDCYSSFLVTPGAYKNENNLQSQIMVFKLKADGSDLLFSTHVGGSSWEHGMDIHLDSMERPVICGYSASEDFPVSEGAFQTEKGAGADVVVFKMDSDGSSLLFSTFVGGKETGSPGQGFIHDEGNGLTMDGFDNIYVTGSTNCVDFPTTDGAPYESYQGSWDDVFLFKLNHNGSKLLFSTFFGGGGSEKNEEGWDVVLDDDGNMIVGGWTKSTNFPTTPGVYRRSHSGSVEGFVFEIDRYGKNITFSTFIGPGFTHDIHLRKNGDPVSVGWTESSNFPTTDNAYDKKSNGKDDVFISEISTDGARLVNSTYFGGSNKDVCWDFSIDDIDRIVLAGYTESTDLPLTDDAFQRTMNTSVTGACEGFFSIFGEAMGFRPMNLGFEMKNGMVDLDWQPPIINREEYTGFAIYRSMDNGTFSELARLERGVTNYRDTDIINGGKYYYYVTAFLDDLESFPTRVIEVFDGSDPVIEEILYPSIVSMDDPIEITANITDNVLVENATIHLFKDQTGSTSFGMENTGGTGWRCSILLGEYHRNLSLTLTASDPSGNEVTSETLLVTVEDPYPPDILEDLTPSEVPCGSDLEFAVLISENLGLSSANVEFWTETRPPEILTLLEGGDDVWRITIEVPHSLERIDYRFIMEDTAHHILTSDVRAVQPLDIEAPVIISKGIPGILEMDDMVSIGVEAWDNIAIDRVEATYHFDLDDPAMERMIFDGSYILNISVPLNRTSFSVYFTAYDTSGNHMGTDNFLIPILDSIPPVISSDWFPDNGPYSTGSNLEIRGNISDNIGLSSVSLRIWSAEGVPVTLILGNHSGMYAYNFDFPLDSDDPIYFMLNATDLDGNMNSTGTVVLQVLDTILPWIEPIDDMEFMEGEYMNLTVFYGDNIDVGAPLWQGPFDLHGDTVSLRMLINGSYTFTVMVMDLQGNRAYETFNVTVRSSDEEPGDDDDDDTGPDDEIVEEEDEGQEMPSELFLLIGMIALFALLGGAFLIVVRRREHPGNDPFEE